MKKAVISFFFFKWRRKRQICYDKGHF